MLVSEGLPAVGPRYDEHGNVTGYVHGYITLPTWMVDEAREHQDRYNILMRALLLGEPEPWPGAYAALDAAEWDDEDDW